MNRREMLRRTAAALAAAAAPASLRAQRPPRKTVPDRTPALFVSHGAPSSALDRDDYTAALEVFGSSIAKPRAILVVSAHWQRRTPLRVTSAERPQLIYDFSGFPEALYRVRYACPGAPALATTVVARLAEAGFDVEPDPTRGLDHGVWTPLVHAYPAADVPVVALSLPSDLPRARLVDIGRALAPLREEGVLLVGSGGMVHNLRALAWGDAAAPTTEWADAFESWAWERIHAGDAPALAELTDAPHARMAHPTTEHYDPLVVVMGAQLAGDEVLPVYRGVRLGSLSLATFALDRR